MADIKWSAFPLVSQATTGDFLVGERAGVNVRFAPPGTMSLQNANNVAITGGTATFTDLTAGYIYVNVPASISLAATDSNVLFVTPNSGVDIAGDIGLAAVTNGFNFAIKNVSSGNVTFTPLAGQFIDGAASLTIPAQGGVIIAKTATQWSTIAENSFLILGGSGILPLAKGGTQAALTASFGSVAYSTASAMAFSAVGSTGQLFQSTGAGAPGWTTATYPATAGTNLNVLLSDGLNFISGTLTSLLDNAFGNARGDVLYRNATVWTVLAPGTSGQFLQTQGAGADVHWAPGDGAGTVTSIATNNGLTGGTITSSGTIGLAAIADHTLLANISGGSLYPSSTTLTALIDNAIGSTRGDILYRNSTVWTILAPGSAGQLLQTGGAAANPAYTTATYPATAGTTGKILISDGTNIVSSTPTYPNSAGTIGNVITSDGTNFISSPASGGGALNYQLSTSSGNFSTPSNSLTAVTNLSVTITTTGNPVMLILQDDGNTTNAGNTAISSTGATGKYAFFRGASQLNLGIVISQLSIFIPSSTISFMDVIGAGTYTYTIQVSCDIGSVYMRYIKLLAYELK